MIKILNLDQLSDNQKLRLLNTILENINLEVLLDLLRNNNVKDRTKIYKAFRHPYYYNANNDTDANLAWEESEQQLQERDNWTTYLITLGLFDKIVNTWISTSQGYNIFNLLKRHLKQPIRIEYI